MVFFSGQTSRVDINSTHNESKGLTFSIYLGNEVQVALKLRVYNNKWKWIVLDTVYHGWIRLEHNSSWYTKARHAMRSSLHHRTLKPHLSRPVRWIASGFLKKIFNGREHHRNEMIWNLSGYLCREGHGPWSSFDRFPILYWKRHGQPLNSSIIFPVRHNTIRH